MPTGKQLERSKIDQIRELSETGWSQRQIGERVGCSQTAVHNVLRLDDDNIPGGKTRGGPRKLSEKEGQLARDLKGAGESVGDIRRQLKTTVSVPTIYRRGKCNNNGREGTSQGEGVGEEVPCFFCLSSCKREKLEQGGNGKILLKYLLRTKNGGNEALLRDITDEIAWEGQCDQCREETGRIGSLHQGLEKMQMEMVHQLKQFRGKILQHFVRGRSREELAKILEAVVPLGSGGFGGAEAERKHRKLLELLADFQRAVDDKGQESVDVPCVILDRFAFNRDLPTKNAWASVEGHNVTVKRETVGNDEAIENDDDFGGFLDEGVDDMAPSDSEYEVAKVESSPRKNARRSPVRKRIQKKKVINPAIPGEPPGELKVEPEEPPSKRRRRAASTKATNLMAKPSRKKGAPVKNRERNGPLGRPGGPFSSESPPKEKKSLMGIPKSASNTVGKLSCDLCPFQNKRNYFFESHLRSHDAQLRRDADQQQPAPYTCDHCSKSYFCQQLLTFHMEGHDGKRTIECDSCTLRVPYPEIEAHVRTHTDNIFACLHCSFCSTTRDRYLKHLRYHAVGPMKCDLCPKTCPTKSKLLKHLFVEHQVGKRHCCEVENCNKSFLSRSSLKMHQYLHTNPQECPQCGKMFRDKNLLATHQRSVHAGDRSQLRVECPDCHESFPYAATLARHRISVHGADKYKCEYCGREYMDKGQLQVHVALHEGTGIPCETCGKVFGNKTQWKRHQVVHATEHSHICEECGKGFTCHQGLKRHSAIHGGEKNFKCQFCGKAFLFRKYMIAHERTHTGERPFTCEFCGKGFTQHGSISLHMKNVHPEQSKDVRKPGKSFLGVDARAVETLPLALCQGVSGEAKMEREGMGEEIGLF